MVDAKEIRIGNWFHHNAEWSYRSETKRSNPKEFIFQWEETDWYALAECTLFLDQISPIPITPELLIACGFAKNGFNEHERSIAMFEGQYKKLIFANDFLFLREEGNQRDKRHQDGICVLWNKDIKKNFYLHQLQNLFYFITGEELSYTPLTQTTPSGSNTVKNTEE